MRRLFVSAVAFLFLLNTLSASAQSYCAAVSGQWYGGVINTINSGAYYDLKDVQGNPQTITGTYNNYDSGCAPAQVSGTMNTNGTFQITVQYPGGGDDCPNGIETWQASFYTSTSCSQVLMTIDGGGNTAYHRSSCPVPNTTGNAGTTGEGPSIFVTWEPPAHPSPGVAEFQATILPPINALTGLPYTYFNWNGRGPTETFSNFNNTCTPYPIGAPSPGPTFEILNGNEILDDLGWLSASVVDGVRSHDVVPCQLTFTQTMNIDCNSAYGVGTVVPYQTNPILWEINSSTITLQRNGTSTTPPNEPYATPQPILRAIAVLIEPPLQFL